MNAFAERRQSRTVPPYATRRGRLPYATTRGSTAPEAATDMRGPNGDYYAQSPDWAAPVRFAIDGGSMLTVAELRARMAREEGR
ncbi:MAG TPA: hypothetical protein VFI40_04775 [Nocardioides sp.]|nr:hypothetical protein [Nocardioides sp.]